MAVSLSRGTLADSDLLCSICTSELLFVYLVILTPSLLKINLSLSLITPNWSCVKLGCDNTWSLFETF